MPIYRMNEYFCGENYLELQIYPLIYTRGRGKRKKVEYRPSRKCQQALNENNRARHLNRLVNHNFTQKDYYITLTFEGQVIRSSYAVYGADFKRTYNVKCCDCGLVLECNCDTRQKAVREWNHRVFIGSK